MLQRGNEERIGNLAQRGAYAERHTAERAIRCSESCESVRWPLLHVPEKNCAKGITKAAPTLDFALNRQFLIPAGIDIAKESNDYRPQSFLRELISRLQLSEPQVAPNTFVLFICIRIVPKGTIALVERRLAVNLKRRRSKVSMTHLNADEFDLILTAFIFFNSQQGFYRFGWAKYDVRFAS